MAEGAQKVSIKRPGRSTARVSPIRKLPGLSASKDGSRPTANLLQPALKVGAVNDPLEREAETMADRIVSMPAPQPAPPAAPPSSPPQGMRGNADQLSGVQRAAVDDQPDLDTLEASPTIPADHQDPEISPEEDVDTAGLTADDMTEIEGDVSEDGTGDPPPPQEEPDIQLARTGDAAMVGNDGGVAPADVARRVAHPGGGRPLSTPVRTFMEPRFGKDFSQVRIHDAPEDRAAAKRIGARAFTHRHHIWLGPGETAENRRLMAHELTHVVQQTNSMPARSVKRSANLSEEAGEPQLRRFPSAATIEGVANQVPGYKLVCLILGKSPITGTKVIRNATNFLGALLAMIPGGEGIFKRLQETGALQNAFDWVNGRLTALNITWTRIKGLIDKLKNLSWAALFNPIEYTTKLFAPIVSDILTFIIEVKDRILEFIVRAALKLAGPWAEKIWGIIKMAGGVISTILSDPLGFAKNLFAAVLKGFNQFGTNAAKHIKKGLLGWLLGTMRGLDIEIPDKLDFKGLLSIGLQIVGLTYANFRAKLVKRLGANGERKVAYLEKSIEVIKILITEGFAGLWQRVLEMIDNFKETVIGGIKDFVMNSLIMGGLNWLASLTNPAGAIIKIVLSIYNMIKTFLERLDQIMEVANSIFSSIGNIASGKIQQAADLVERTIAGTIPVVISFLAALVPIKGITSSIRNIIKKLRAPVDKAMGKMITFLVKKAKKLLSKIIGKLNGKRKLPSASFSIGKASHRIYAEKSGKSVKVMIASKKPQPLKTVKERTKLEAQKVKDPKAKAAVDSVVAHVSAAEEKMGPIASRTNLTSKKANQSGTTKKLGKETDQNAKQLGADGKEVTKNPQLSGDGTKGGALVRHVPERYAHEGDADSWSALQSIMTKEPVAGPDFERDHIPTKEALRAILNVKGGVKKKAKGKAAPLGLLQTHSVEGNAGSHQAIILYLKRHGDKGAADTAKVSEIASSKESRKVKIDGFKEFLVKHVKDQTDKVRKAYSAEGIPEILSKVNKGLVKIINAANKNFNLGQPTVLDNTDGESSGDMGSSKEPGRDPRTQMFAPGEGTSGPHSSIKSKYSKKGEIESDHLIDYIYVKTVQKWKVGDVWSGISPSIQNEIDRLQGKDRESAEKRRDRLKSTPLFHSSRMKNYTHDNAMAIALDFHVHRSVSSALARKTEANVRQDILAELGENRMGDLLAYVKGLNDKDPPVLAKQLQQHIKPVFDDRFSDHAAAIQREYKAHKSKVVKLNPDNKNKAEKKMEDIISEVRKSINALGKSTFGLFD